MLLFIGVYVILFIDIYVCKFNGLEENPSLKIVGNLMMNRAWEVGTQEWCSQKTSIISSVLFLKKTTVTNYQYSKIINSGFGEDEFFCT